MKIKLTIDNQTIPIKSVVIDGVEMKQDQEIVWDTIGDVKCCLEYINKKLDALSNIVDNDPEFKTNNDAQKIVCDVLMSLSDAKKLMLKTGLVK